MDDRPVIRHVGAALTGSPPTNPRQGRSILFLAPSHPKLPAFGAAALTDAASSGCADFLNLELVFRLTSIGRARQRTPVPHQTRALRPGFETIVEGIWKAYYRSQKAHLTAELEISDLNRMYLDAGTLNVVSMGRGDMWLDGGTFDSVLEAGESIAAIERRQGFIDAIQMRTLAERIVKSGYGTYLLNLFGSGE
jgi:hypothetical protein